LPAGKDWEYPYDGVTAARRQLDFDVIQGVDVEEVLLAVKGEPPLENRLSWASKRKRRSSGR
jgi:hypothetical protein